MKSKNNKTRRRRPERSETVHPHVIAGPHAIEESLRSQHCRATKIWATDATLAHHSELHDAIEEAKIPLEMVDRTHLDERFEGLRHQGIVAEATPYSYVAFDALMAEPLETQLIVALDQITDPHNFGAIVRSAVVFGAAGIIITKDRCADVNATTVRTSAGATEHARIVVVTNLAQSLKKTQDSGYQVVGLAGEASFPLESVGPRVPRILVIGSEGDGLRRLTRERCDVLARIPMTGPISSLNASVAAAIAMYALTL